jgi:hypothetical protein
MIVEEFKAISNQLDKKVTCAQELVNMDTYKNNLLLEMVDLQKKLMQNRKCFFFLVKNDPPLEEIFTEEGTTWHLIYKLHHWPARINDELELADNRHRE